MRIFIACLAGFSAAAAFAQMGGRAAINPDHPAIQYWRRDSQDPVAELVRKLADGSAVLRADPKFGLLPSLLEELRIPVESQILVFSKTSLQSAQIGPESPRAIYFNDSVAVGWVRDSPMIELAAHDPEQGVVFYTVTPNVRGGPSFSRDSVCLSCHHTASTLGAPGMLVRSIYPSVTGLAVTGLAGTATDHRTPYSERWGGWYITGRRGPLRHLANAVVGGVRGGAAAVGAVDAIREPPPERFSIVSYPAPTSDIAALAVFEHQAHMMNLITRIAWTSRVAVHEDPAGRGAPIVDSAARELVDYMLFIDEAPLTAPIEGSSGFSEKFSAQGPFDSKGRSLRQLDLNRRLMRYPCSYLVHSTPFQALPADAKAAVYRRLWEVLSGKETDPRYKRLSADDRRAVIEILTETIDDFPEHFR